MRQLIVSEFLTLDGVMESPNEWSFDFRSDESAQIKFAELAASDALLLGRVTYEGFAQAWPHMTEVAGEYANMMNGYPKYVVSMTLENPEWNNSHVVSGNLAEEVNKLKQQPGKDILVFGSNTLVHSLMQENLIDEYRLMVYPVTRGKGKRLFPEGDSFKLNLVQARSDSAGVVLLTYKPA